MIWVAVLALGNLKAHVAEYIAAALGAGVLYLVSTWVVLRLPDTRRLLFFIFAMGLLFRVTLFPLYPSLSDDLLRYRWEGKAQLAGLNPYAWAPNAPELRALRDSTWPAVNGKEFSTMYPPLTELIYREMYRISPSVLAMKLPAMLFDTASAVMLVLLLARLGLPASRVLIYYWCPLTVVEFAASGHNDSIAVFFLLAALVAEESNRPPMALLSLAASAASKLFGAFLAPVLFAREWRCFTSRYGRPLLWPVLLLAALCWPFRHGLPNIVPALAVASGHWRNNDSVFRDSRMDDRFDHPGVVDLHGDRRGHVDCAGGEAGRSDPRGLRHARRNSVVRGELLSLVSHLDTTAASDLRESGMALAYGDVVARVSSVDRLPDLRRLARLQPLPRARVRASLRAVARRTAAATENIMFLNGSVAHSCCWARPSYSSTPMRS